MPSVTLTDPSGTTTYTWNTRNQLVSLSGPGVTASFQYDAFGRRIRKAVNGAVTDFLYDDENIVQELSNGTPQANLLTGLETDEYLTRTDVVGNCTFLMDGLGSVLALTDNLGIVQTEYKYEPFGKVTALGAPSTNPFQYTGRENDGSPLFYHRARYYYPELQRFISQDPIEFEGGDPNLYLYVSNDPIDYYDSSGENAFSGTADALAHGIEIANPAVGSLVRKLVPVVGPALDWIFPAPAGDPTDSYYPPIPDDYNGYKEHTKGKRPSTQKKHEEGQKRREMDKKKKEKGDARRKRYK